MIVASDMCRGGGAPSKYPRFGGSNGFFEKIPEKTAGVRLYSALAPPLLFPLGYTPKTPEHQKDGTKKPSGGQERPRSAS